MAANRKVLNIVICNPGSYKFHEIMLQALKNGNNGKTSKTKKIMNTKETLKLNENFGVQQGGY